MDENLILNKEICERDILRRECTSPTNILKNPTVPNDQTDSLLKSIPVLNEIFTLHGRIGEGTFSSVLLARLRKNPNEENETQSKKDLFAIKHLVPTCHPSRIERELRCLQEIGGKDNVIGIEFCLRSKDSIVFVMPYINHERFSDYVQAMDVTETRSYMKHLLVALRRVHSFGIIHRDVKPSNFLYDRERKRFLLVDFGLAQHVNQESTSEGRIIIEKRKRAQCGADQVDNSEPSTKRLALQANVIPSPIKQKKNSPNKENYPHFLQKNTPVKSPFKSPFKNYNSISGILSPKQMCYAVKSLKSPGKMSPFKYPGLDLRVNRVKVSPKKHINYTSIQSTIRKLSFAEFDNTENCVNPQVVTNERQSKNPVVNTNKLVPKETLSFSRPAGSTLNRVTCPPKGNIKKCDCFGKPQVCNICLLKKGMYAPRAGTPGFRPPEVLLKYTKQTTAIDIWAAGVILISILSGCYPFFKSPDDVTALAEIMTLFGSEKLVSVGKLLGSAVLTSEYIKPLNLKQLCLALRFRFLHKPSHPSSCLKCRTEQRVPCLCYVHRFEKEDPFPDSAYDLLLKLLDVNPHSRITADEALKHSFFQ